MAPMDLDEVGRLAVRCLDPTSVLVRSGFDARERLLADHVALGDADPHAVALAIARAVELQRRS